MLFVIVIGILTSHRIAGPAFRMQQEIARVLAGEKGVRMKLRKKDSFHELADDVNSLVERLDQLGGGQR
jgi:methyl-accepting chemotaxis protein